MRARAAEIPVIGAKPRSPARSTGLARARSRSSFGGRTKRRAGAETFRTQNRRPIDRAFIEGIFLRDKPGTTDPAVARACAEAQVALGDSVPTGTYLDMTTRLPLVDPAAILAPTLVVRGEHDGIATLDDLADFFKRLPTGDKRLAVLPDVAHCTPLGTRRHLLWRAMQSSSKRVPPESLQPEPSPPAIHQSLYGNIGVEPETDDRESRAACADG